MNGNGCSTQPDYLFTSSRPPSPTTSGRSSSERGEHGQRLLDGLILRLRFVSVDDDSPAPDLTTALHIQSSNLYPLAFVNAAGENLIVLTVVFPLLESSHRACYYLVYDSDDMSLAMIPSAPDEDPVSGSLTTLNGSSLFPRAATARMEAKCPSLMPDGTLSPGAQHAQENRGVHG
nr:unnamed protein product [Digitaria exilis]